MNHVSKKASTTVKIAHTVVLCASPSLSIVDDLDRLYAKCPGPIPSPRDYLSYERIGIKPPPSPLLKRLHRAKHILKRPEKKPEKEHDERLLRSLRSLINNCRANVGNIDLQAQSLHSPNNQMSFNLMAVPIHKKRGKKDGMLAPLPAKRRKKK